MLMLFSPAYLVLSVDAIDGIQVLRLFVMTLLDVGREVPMPFALVFEGDLGGNIL